MTPLIENEKLLFRHEKIEVKEPLVLNTALRASRATAIAVYAVALESSSCRSL
jgi:hypothetical protein